MQRTRETDLPQLRGPLTLALTSVGLAALLAACATAPPSDKQLTSAANAITHASGASAREFAPDQLRAASTKLAQAQAARNAKEYEQADRLAQQAQVDAELAEAMALARKASVAAERTQTANQALREELDRQGTQPPAGQPAK